MTKQKSSYVCSVSISASKSDISAVKKEFAIPRKVCERLLKCNLLTLRLELFDFLRSYFNSLGGENLFDMLLTRAFFSGEFDDRTPDYLFVKIYNKDALSNAPVLSECFTWDVALLCWS